MTPSAVGQSFQCRVGALSETPDAFARAVEAGLSAPRKTLPCRYLYDARGSQLFDDITRQPEYYLTRAETEILEAHADDIATAAGNHPRLLVELGPGDGSKARFLMQGLLRRQPTLTYRPVDVSESALRYGSSALLREFSQLNVDALATDFEDGLRSIFENDPAPALIAFLGSSFGNFDHAQGPAFLSTVRAHARPDDLFLLGLDLRKDETTLLRAYDDAAGVTAAFNLNLLQRINSELGGHFPLERFVHEARFDAVAGRMEMHLRSLDDQSVRVDALARTFDFLAGETIWTESSYKFSSGQIAEMCALTGWSSLNEWRDAASRFTLLLLAPSHTRGFSKFPAR